MKKKRIIIVTAILAALAVLGILLFGISSTDSKINYITAKVERGNISESITATGSIEPVTEVEVGTQVSGIIDKIYVDYNSYVKRGEVIAEMDRIMLQSELASQKASYNGTKAEYEFQYKNNERNKELHEKHHISDSEFEQTVYNYEKAKSAFESAQASLAKAERNLSYATITSPIDGVVISRSVEAGQTVASGFETPTLFTIAADLTQMQVIADVDEADIGEVKEGQRATFTVDAYPNDIFEGEVTQIRLGETSSSSSSSNSSSTVVTYEVVITASNPEQKLKPRLTANVTIYTIDLKNVLCVPSRAFRFNPDRAFIGKTDTINDCGAEHKLWMYKDNTFTSYPIKTGISNGVITEIIEGIPEGAEIITEISVSATSETDGKGAPSDAGKSPFMPTPPGQKNKNK